MQHQEVVIIGAGPAGLTAAYLLSKNSVPVTVLEADPHYVGGIARTIKYKDYCFDIGGHRFFSKSSEVEDLWTEILPNDMLTRPRSSRIFYKNKFFAYPIKLFDVLAKLGLFESFLCFLSYLKAKMFPVANPKSFTEWVTNNFGKRLYTMFFKTYTEKVWGMRCEDISADWAVQRIQGLSFWTAITNSLFPHLNKKNVIKTIIGSFRYPRKGPGMLWEECARKITAAEGKILLGSRVKKCEFVPATQTWKIIYENNGASHSLTASHLISSAPIRELLLSYLQNNLSLRCAEAAAALRYRDFLIVALILKGKERFTDNWIYIHDPHVTVGRIQNFKSWSPEMIPNDDTCCYGMEYFCFENDGLWKMTDAALIDKAKQELIQIGLASAEDIIDGCVVRQPKAYPVYDDNYQQKVNIIRNELSTKFPSLYLVGRNGMHKYNNQDHAMMTAMLTVKNIMAGQTLYDVWNVNQDAEYHEADVIKNKIELRAVPYKHSTAQQEQ